MKKLFLFTASALLASLGSAQAVCKKPVGTFVGGAAGETYIGGSPYNVASILLTEIFNKDGSGSHNMVSKTTSAAPPSRKYSASSTFTAASHTFDATMCRGTIVDSGGAMRVYVVSESGNTVDLMEYSDSDGIMVMIFNLKKSL